MSRAIAWKGWHRLFARQRALASERAAQHAAHDAADKGRPSGIGGAAVNRGRGRSGRRRWASDGALGPTGRAAVGLVAGTCGGRGDDLAQQRLVLKLVEKAALGIAAGGLPAADDGAGLRLELAGNLGIEAESGEAALYVAALPL